MGNIYFAGGSGGGVDPDDCTATTAQVLEGHTAGVNGYDDPVEGTMPYQKQEGTLNCGQSSIILPGYHDGTRSITANSLASQTPGTASAANIYPGQTAWVNGNKVTGTMATQGGGTYTAGTADKTVVAANRFVTGNVVVKGDANLTAGNIKKGVKIMGITGSWEGYVGGANDLYYNGANNAKFSGSTQSSLSLLRFDSNQIYVGSGGNNNVYLKSGNSYNLTPYSRLNIQFVGVKTWSKGFAINLDNPHISLVTAPIEVNVQQTVYFNISAHQLTTKINFTMWANSSGTSGTNAAQIYIQRIYLS